MINFKSFSLLIFTVGFIFAAANPGTAQADLVINMYEDGNDVRATFSGSFDTTSWINLGGGTRSAQINPSSSLIALGNAPINRWIVPSAGFSTPGSYGTGGVAAADSSTGDYFEIDPTLAGGTTGVFTTAGYTSGSLLSGESVWNNTTLAGLGVTEGTYTWNFANSANNVVLNAGAQSVPEPSSALLLGLVGVAGVTFRRRRA